MQMVPLGRYKVAWWGTDGVLHSAMYEEYEDARTRAKAEASRGFQVTVMEAMRVGDGTYDWKMLPDELGRFWPFLTTLGSIRTELALGACVFALGLAISGGRGRDRLPHR